MMLSYNLFNSHSLRLCAFAVRFFLAFRSKLIIKNSKVVNFISHRLIIVELAFCIFHLPNVL